MTRNADSVASGELWRTAPDGGNAEMLLPGTPAVWEAELTRDGAWIAYRINDRVISGSIFARRVRGDTIARPVVQTPADERMIALAPDGRWMAFTSDVTGVMEVYVVAFPSGAARNLVSRGGGTMPRWRADGRELYYAGPRGMMAVPITSRDGALVAGEPVSLFPTGAYELRANRQEYDVTPDGQRFLLVRPLGSRGDAPLVHVQNLAALVRRKAQP
jgi:hypothetical protein